MPRILKIADLAERKRALAAQSDIYRETLKFELLNLQLYGLQARKRFSSFGSSNPLLVLAASLAGALIKDRRSPKLRLLAGAFFAWKLFRKVRSLFPGFFARNTPARKDNEEEQQAVAI